LDGQQGAVDIEAAVVTGVCNDNGALSCKQATSDEERNKLWAARRAALFISLQG